MSKMQRITLKRTGDVVRKVFEILLAQPEGLPDRVVLEDIRRCFFLADLDRVPEERSSMLQAFERVTYLGTIAPVKAGWLVNQNSRWSVTDEGRRAYHLFRDPE